MQPRPREIFTFVAKFSVVFALLMVPWRFVGEAYSLIFSMGATMALETVVDEREFKLRFEPTADPWGVRFLGDDVRAGKRTELSIEARGIGYVPAATLLALAFATPLSGKRRRTALLVGAGAIWGRVALGVGLPVAHYVGLFSGGSLLDEAARTAFSALIEPPDMAYATPLVAFLVALAATQPTALAPATVSPPMHA